MEVRLCDECGKKLDYLWYCRGIHTIIGFTGKVNQYIIGTSRCSGEPVAEETEDLDYEVCSKKCLLTHLRKKL